MASPAPLVVIPTPHLASGRVLGWSAGGYALPDRYVAALDRAGARTVLLPPTSAAPPDEALAPFSGLLLPGGGDIEPARYGAKAHPEIYGTHAERDEAELALARAAIDMGIPTMAICRGLQILNVAAGGTLHQHLDDVEGMLAHGRPVAGASVFHHVKVASGTRLADVSGCETLLCTSHHHQGVDRLGEGFVPSAWSDDGLVEGIEPEPDGPWVMAVQWHPEMTAANDPYQQALFDGFVAEARRRAER
ncbi:MAG: gamma-glutamyl-gamma-aminobutyrate hydrolase family protein [Actinomycetota bacterium]|nr:gamma-glutamyl-gamma-aminobutyrate hydrolase family protein [Actinomycetota bacterium]